MVRRDLSINFCGFHCINPFFLAACPVSRTGEMVQRAFEAGWGGVVTKSISLDQDLPDHSLSPRFCGLRPGGSGLKLQKNIIGMGNMDFRIDISVKDTFDSFARAKAAYPDRMLIISVKGKFQREEWHKLSLLAKAAGADAVEACLSCPDAGAGGSIGQNPEALQKVLSWMREVIDLPILVKMTPHVTNSAMIANAAKEGGAVAVSAINTFKGIGGINLANETPLPTVRNHSTSVGISGANIRPMAQYCVYEVAKNVSDLQISGVGGITCAQDAIEYLLLGASTIQVGTQVMHEGYRLVEDMAEGLSRYLEKHHYRSVREMVGSALSSYVASTEGLSREQQLKSNVDQELCIHCGRCYIACRDGAYQAIRFSEDREATVEKEDCVGCGLCRLVCPVPGAIYFTDDAGRRDALN